MTLHFEAKHRLGKFALDAAFTSDRGVTALFGRSGSGKTSIIRIISGLTRPDQGKLVVDGDVLVDTQKGIFVPKHKRRFATVFQEGRLFPHLTVQQNLNYGRWFAPRDERADNFSRIVDLLGIGSILDRRPEKLSGGEKQRVAIGRALLSSPRLLLMDEPLAALDDARKMEILPYLEALRDEVNIPIVYVSHSVPEVARLADRVIVVSEGRVAMAGTASAVLSQPSVSITADRTEAGSLVEGRVEHYDARHRLLTIGFKTLRIYVSGTEIAEGKAVRVHILAKDVMLSTVQPEQLSALNILEGTVSEISHDQAGTVDVRVDCQGTPVLARITELSCERLGLTQGTPVFAIIKTVALEPH
ncbi:molybdenum ABC transporter ATP-binding protein [Phyllobacterium brassicacearum]|uniref:Molybdenum ABC transporter ATP-binding protein n=1 Tax=Phyllobacterium brassicacearum TaxID=314235 RepID=A0A2P7B757_9HYPH|nr:molybdenum ABC transporter ATP-binding protein [Phyllobacterium brassicacearum]PSH62289.1 molybdenum ABC transporter ATP-binding protein [Phyllobacterium brassicacearum]TDQ16726.1 molybdate transport system ATP-binding protein [Phyllobacterium brassicacearum]